MGQYWVEHYLVRQPGSLEAKATWSLAQWIASQEMRFQKRVIPESDDESDVDEPGDKLVTDEPYDETKAEYLLSQQIAITRSYLEHNLPGKFHDNLLVQVVLALHRVFYNYDYYYNEMNLGHVIETLLTNHLRTLSFRDLSYRINGDYIYSKSHMFTGLTNLELQYTTKEKDTIRMLNELHSLKCLKFVGRLCTGDILKCIAENCKLIETVDLSTSDIRDFNINILTQLRNLRCVALPHALSVPHVASLLMSCENIEQCTYRDISKVLEHIALLEENKQLKLKSYANNDETTLDQIKLVVKMCPLIQDVTLVKDNLSKDFLQCLNDLQHMRELTLNGYDFYTDGVKEVLEVKGNNLTLLFLNDAKQVDLNALKYISSMCQNLQSLKLHNCVEKMLGRNMFPNNIGIPPLKHLKLIYLGGYENSQITGEQLYFLLSNSPNVEIFDCGINSLTHDVILSVLDQTPKKLTHLREMKINTELSMLAIDRILQNCINNPIIKKRKVTYPQCGFRGFRRSRKCK